MFPMFINRGFTESMKLINLLNYYILYKYIVVKPFNICTIIHEYFTKTTNFQVYDLPYVYHRCSILTVDSG